MLSRREKLLVQPWEERRYKDHRSKVQGARAAVDARAPAPRPHVELKLKRWQREAERRAAVANDNFSLIQRLARIMRRNRLDNHWDKPLPKRYPKSGTMIRKPGSDDGIPEKSRGTFENCSGDYFQQKVGKFHDAEALQRRLAARAGAGAARGPRG